MKNNFIVKQLEKVLLTPIKSIKKQYIPLLLIYFSYGASGFSSIALMFWEKENLTLSAEQLLSIGIWIMVPWTLKMVFGQLVDSVPIMGNRRKSYIYIGALFMAIGTTFLLGVTGDYQWTQYFGGQYNMYLLASLFSTIGFVIQDVTADTMSTEVVPRTMKDKNGKNIKRTEKDIQHDLAMVQVLGRLALSIAGVIVAKLGGVLADNLEHQTVFFLTFLIPILSCISVNFIKLETNEKERTPIDWKILGGGISFAIFSIFMAINNFNYSQEIVFFVSLIILIAMIHLTTKSLPKDKLKILIGTMIALFVYRATPGVGPGMSWWMIDVLQFDPSFIGTLRQIGSITALLFLWFFADFITSKPIKYILILLIVSETILSLPELGLFYNFHETLGLSARTVALFDTAIESPLVHVSMVPLLTLLAYYAPPENRGTWFAVGASFMNLAITASGLLTKYLNQIFIVTREVINDVGEVVTQANYDALGPLLLIKISVSFIIPLAITLLLVKDDTIQNTKNT